MAADNRLIDKAVTALNGKYTRDAAVADLIDCLAGFAPFDEMDDEEIEPVARAARDRLAPGRARPAAGASRAGGGAAPAAARSVRPDLVPAAPFRFVTLPDTVVPPERPVRLDLPLPDGFCADVDVEWAAETPLLIGAENGATGVVEPMTLGKAGGYVIPGATLRGMIRAAVEIVAHGRLGPANLHHRYGLRDFEHPAYAVRSPVSRVGEVKAGWLEMRTIDGAARWVITPCEWAHVLIDDLLASRHGHWPARDRRGWIGLDLTEKYRAVGMQSGRSVDFTRTFGFSTAPEDNGRRMVRPADGPRRGTLVFANKLPGRDGNKTFEYVFFAPAGAAVPLDPAVVATFERLYSKPSKNRPQPDGSWRVLKPTLEAGGRLPVFLVGDLERQDDGFFFGLTRLFKVPHERSVGTVLAQTQPDHLPAPVRDADGVVTGYKADFVEALFGYVVERDALGLGKDDRIAPDAAGRKGRVAFSFAHLVPGQRARLSDPVTAVMMAPRASFAPFYLRSPAEKDYSADTPPKLAGRKRYLARHRSGRMAEALAGIAAMGERQIRRIEESSRGKPVSDDVKTRLRFLLPEGAAELRFRSTIRLHNVTAAELGAVLFALTHGGDPDTPCRHLVGRARPFGAGQMRVVQAQLTARPNTGTGEPAADTDHAPFLEAFRAYMRGQHGLAAFPDVPAVQEFLGAGTPAAAAALGAMLDYLPLKDFNDIRKAVKPVKPDEKRRLPAKPPHRFPGDGDGRLLPAPPRPPKPSR